MHVWKSLNIRMKETTTLHSIAYFTKIQKTHTCIAYFNKRKWQLKRLTFLSPLKFHYLLKILWERSSILRIAEDTMSTDMCGFPVFQISSVYKSLHSCRGDWKESQSWCWIGTQNICKLFIYRNAKVTTWVKNNCMFLSCQVRVSEWIHTL